MVVTNLRLPGQHDERLLASLGLQGPYYNWNRWYLPGVGRYMELDRLALRGGVNNGFSPDWYNYGGGNPLMYTDPFGLDRYAPCSDKRTISKWICKKAIDKTCKANPESRRICCMADETDCRMNFAPDDSEGQSLCAALEKACEMSGDFKQPPPRPKKCQE